MTRKFLKGHRPVKDKIIKIILKQFLNRTRNKDIFKISENFLEICFPFSQDYLDTIQDKGQDTGHDTGQVTRQVKQILSVCENTKSKSELMELLHLKGRDNFEKLYLKPALSYKLLEMTIPEKPKSRNQKYRLTEKGKQYKKQFES